MGLDFSHCEARWSYSGFGQFRRRLAQEIGVDLNKMYGFGGTRTFHTINDPIKYLLDHSDCDGNLDPVKCRKIIPRLRKLVSNWADNDYDKKQALELADGMEYCASKNRHLMFL